MDIGIIGKGIGWLGLGLWISVGNDKYLQYYDYLYHRYKT